MGDSALWARRDGMPEQRSFHRMDVRHALRSLWPKSANIFGLALLALFVQAAQAQGPLNYFKNYFVTGDYVVGGVGLSGKVASGPVTGAVQVTGNITLNSVPCTSGPGLFASVVPCTNRGAVPADVIGAFLYWQTIESTTTPSSAIGSYASSFNAATPVNPFVGLALGNPKIPACSGGGTSAQYMHNYRADVLKYLPINSTANVRVANGAQTFTLVSGDTTTQFVGATLVVIYRLVTPGNPRIAPLRSVVLYDGAFTGTASSSLNQTMGGFYQASSGADAKMTHIVGNGQSISKGSKEKQTLLVNGGIPQGVPSDPFVGAQGANWDNYTFNYNLAQNASSVDTQVLLTQDCLSWGAIITSTEVQDSDFDGLLDIWETSGLYFDPGVRNDGAATLPTPATFGTCANNSSGCLNLKAMGANPHVPDIFVQIDWMQGAYGAPHTHIPQLGALNMVGAAFKSRGINLHFDVGNNYQTSPPPSPPSPYIINATYAQGGNVISESGNLLCPNSKTSVCAFPQQEADYSLLGWKSGLDAIKNGDSVLGLPQLFAENRKDTFHYALFAHGIAATTPLSTPLAGSISGVGDLPGGDLMVTLGLWRSDTPAVDQVGTQLEQAGTLMHELGHNLDLHHGGWNDTPVCMPNYPSVMNYLYQVQGLTDSAGSEHIDYSSGFELPMSEDFLSAAFPMAFPPGLQQYRVRYFAPFNNQTNTPGQSSQVDCNGRLLAGSEVSYVRLESPAVSTPDWSNGTILPLGRIITSGLDINYDETVGQAFFDQPDWISLNLQQVGARPNANGLSLNVGISDIGISDIGISDIGISDIGISDIGISDIGISDIGISDIGTAQLGQDALGDQDYATFVLSGVSPPTSLTASVYPSTGGTGNLLSWTSSPTVQASKYNIYRCNASAVPSCTPTALTSVASGTPVLTTFTDTVNDSAPYHAGSTCPAASTCYNTTYNYFVTEVVTIGTLSTESGPSNTVSGDVTHLFVMANSQTVTYGTANPTPTFTVYSNVAPTTSLTGASCVYTPASPINAGNYPITCSGLATAPGAPAEGVTYNAASLSYPASLGGTVTPITPGSLTINPLKITVTAVYSTKVYNATTSAGTTSSSPSSPAATPTIAPAPLPYGDMLTATETYPGINVGATYAMAPGPATAANNSTLASNYSPTYFNSAAASVITPAPLTITAATNTKDFDGTTSAKATPTVSGLQGSSDTVTGLAETYTTSGVGTGLTLTVSAGYTVADGNSGKNYTVATMTNNTGIINPDPSITTTSLPTAADQGHLYTQTIAATGGTGALSFTPITVDGVSLSASGQFSGTPTSTGTFPFTATVTDTLNVSATQSLTLTVNTAPSIATTSLPMDDQGRAYTQTIAGTGGTGALSFTPQVVDGVSLNSSGAFTGTPASAGTFTFTATVTDTIGVSVTQQLTLTVNSPPSITTISLPVALQGSLYTQSIAAAGGTGALSFTPQTVDSVTLSPSGAFAGIPASPGSFQFTATVTDSLGVSAAKQLTLVVNSSLSLAPATLAGGDQGILYQPQQLVASGGTIPYGNWNWTPAPSSSLPPGLSLDPSAGTITGTPTAAGTYTFIVSVTDSLGAIASQTYSIAVYLPPTITGANLPAATVGTPYTSAAIPVVNGASPFNWSATGLPAGLSISGGVISGTATGGSFAPPYDAPSWAATASNGGTTTITPNCLANVNVTDAVGGIGSANFLIGSTPSSPCATFGYNLVLAGGVPESTWTFSDNAATTGTLTFNWQYTGFHAFYEVTALLQVFSGSNTVTLYSAGPVDCCSSPSGGFNVQGAATIAVTAGQPFGFTVGGSNFDGNSVLNGTLYITNFAIQ
jgi:hypothetical protein